MRVIDGKRHQFRRFVAGVAEHQALVAGTLVQVVVGGTINALGDVRRLLVVGHQDSAALVVDAVFGVVVADALDGLARDLDVVDVGGRGNFARQYHQSGIAQGFGGDARILVLGEDGVQNGVGNLVGDLVGMAFGNGFRSKEEVVCHELFLQVSYCAPTMLSPGGDALAVFLARPNGTVSPRKLSVNSAMRGIIRACAARHTPRRRRCADAIGPRCGWRPLLPRYDDRGRMKHAGPGRPLIGTP
ncbi:hypothetical protein L602_001600000760 [Cupriavidus gilardii J11]|uniref:Uncharacterized protein n=1 Tax=Cupriavidus gilardii J11 TaxID=936133 RepID=A0A562BQL6_9BURK|nr:hypothetical protein L602_001600000760 [Cupriavidus gilardii J11]